MTALLVHGVPDTPDLWQRVLAHLDTVDVRTPALPGFGGPVPPGFGGSHDDYAAWLVAEIEAIGAPVDLVGHDWGALLVQRVASLRPDLLRTVAFGSGPLDDAYVWHDTAQAWQTPEVGEAVMDGILALSVEERCSILAAGGAEPDLAASQAATWDRRMADAILGLYRSVVDPARRWAPLDRPIGCPTLVLWGGDDPYAPPEYGARVAERTGAELLVFAGCSHWWPWSRATEVAAALTELWARA
ncbi:MAG: alpha/beta fold hydrolase [Actinomycetes bacterium]